MHNPSMNHRIGAILCALTSLVGFDRGATAQSVERTASDRLTRLESDLRFQLEMTWRHKPRQWKARTAEVEQAFAAWRRSPRTGADRQKLEAWLRQSIVSSLPGESGKLPPLPEFSARQVATKQPASSPPLPSPSPTEKQSASTQSAVPATKLPAPASSTVKSALAVPQTQAPQATNPQLPAERLAQPPVIARRTISPPADQAKQSTNQQAETSQPAKSIPRATIAAPGQPPREIRLRPMLQYKPQRATEHRLASRTLENRPSSPLPASPPQRVVAAKPVEEAPAPRPDAPVASSPSATQQQAAASPPLATTPSSDKPAVANETPAMKPSGDAAAPTKPRIAPPAQPTEINLAELNARIGGYHDGLDEIEATVVAARDELTRGQAARLVGLLEQLAGQYQFVRLYYDGLTDRERLFVAQPRPMDETIKLIESQCAALSSTEEADFLAALERASEDDELRQRLESLAKETASPPVRSPDEGE